MNTVIMWLVVNTASVFVTVQLLPGVKVREESLATYLLLGLIFGLVNALLKPVLKLLTFPLIVLTLGLFLLVINALVLLLTAALSGGSLQFASFGDALLAGLVIGAVNWGMQVALRKRGE